MSDLICTVMSVLQEPVRHRHICARRHIFRRGSHCIRHSGYDSRLSMVALSPEAGCQRYRSASWAKRLCDAGSYGSTKRYKSFQRVRKVNEATVIGAGGELSDFQYIMQLLDDLTTQDFTTDDKIEMNPKEIYAYLSRVLYNRRNKCVSLCVCSSDYLCLMLPIAQSCWLLSTCESCCFDKATAQDEGYFPPFFLAAFFFSVAF